MADHVVPTSIADLVENYADAEKSRTTKRPGAFSGKPLDDDGMQDLYQLAGDIYAIGYAEGRHVTNMRLHRADYRQRNSAEPEQES